MPVMGVVMVMCMHPALKLVLARVVDLNLNSTLNSVLSIAWIFILLDSGTSPQLGWSWYSEIEKFLLNTINFLTGSVFCKASGLLRVKGFASGDGVGCTLPHIQWRDISLLPSIVTSASCDMRSSWWIKSSFACYSHSGLAWSEELAALVSGGNSKSWGMGQIIATPGGFGRDKEELVLAFLLQLGDIPRSLSRFQPAITRCCVHWMSVKLFIRWCFLRRWYSPFFM